MNRAQAYGRGWIAAAFALLALLALLAAACASQRAAVRRGSVDIVIAFYKEDLTWLCRRDCYLHELMPYVRTIWIYRKGGVDPMPMIPDADVRARVRVEDLPNVGRCDHTYIHHFARRRQVLAPVTICTTGSSHLAHKWQKLNCVCKGVLHSGDTCLCGTRGDFTKSLYNFQLEAHQAADPKNAAASGKELHPSPIRPFGRWLEAVLGHGTPVNAVSLYGVFAVARHHVHRRPLHTYEYILAMLGTHENPEAGHYMERAWEPLFGPLPD
jgi:hypothetical protein